MEDASSEFRHVDLVKFRELCGSMGLDNEKRHWPTLHKLVESKNRSPDEPEAG